MPSGGKREGAGRPKKKKEHSDKFKNGIWKGLEKKAKATGKSVFDVFADRLYDENTQSSVFASLMKTLADVMATKESKSTVDHNFAQGPVIGLPPIDPKPPEAFYPAGSEMVQ